MIVFPFGWNSSTVRQSCGLNAAQFYPGDCNIKWAYALAIIGCLDGIVLAFLAFILAARHVKLQPEPLYGMNGSLFKGKYFISLF